MRVLNAKIFVSEGVPAGCYANKSFAQDGFRFGRLSAVPAFATFEISGNDLFFE